MGIVYKSVREALTEKNIDYPSLSIFNDRGNVIKVSYWQPKGEIGFNNETGFWCYSDKHMEKATRFLENVKQEKTDLVITPEYSVPWSLLDTVIDNRDMWPRAGKLWCLGMEGISCDSLAEFLDKYKDNESISIITEDIEEMSANSFFSCLIYLFYSNKKIICIMQFKTTAASDKWAELEAAGLTTGNVIYFFSDVSGVNCLFSYICADALNQGISVVRDELSYQKCIILHPQLNPKPLHDSFNTMRKSFLDYSKSNIRIISVNWAKDSVLKKQGATNEIKVKDSYTACYYSDSSVEKINELQAHNKRLGMDIAKDGHILVWHMPSSEHCMSFSIDAFDSKGLNNVTSSHNEPLGREYWEYNNDMWERKELCEACSVDWEWLQKEFDFKKCSKNDCEAYMLHRFFAILFGQKIYKDINLVDGSTNVVFNYKNKLKYEVMRLRERCQFVNKQLKKGNVPTKFSKIKDGNFGWTLSMDGNLHIDRNQRNEVVNVVYVDSSEDALIQKAIIEFQTLMGEAAKDRMLLYYFSDEGIRYYDELYNTNINNPDVTKSIEMIN